MNDEHTRIRMNAKAETQLLVAKRGLDTAVGDLTCAVGNMNTPGAVDLYREAYKAIVDARALIEQLETLNRA